MPRYTLPPLKKRKKHHEEMPEAMEGDESGYPDAWDRQISLPVNDDILQALKVGGAVTVTLKGEVSSLDSTKNADGPDRMRLTVMIDEVEAYPDEVAAEESDMARGFSRVAPLGARRRNY